MCSRNCIIIVIIVFFFVVMIFQNHQVIVTSLGCCWYSGDFPQTPNCWSSCNVWRKMDAGGVESNSGIVIEDVCKDGM